MTAKDLFIPRLVKKGEDEVYLVCFGDSAITLQDFKTKEDAEKWINELPNLPWGIFATMAATIARNIKYIEQTKMK